MDGPDSPKIRFACNMERSASDGQHEIWPEKPHARGAAYLTGMKLRGLVVELVQGPLRFTSRKPCQSDRGV